MIPPAAIQRFTERQRQLVHDTYDQAWQQGVDGYEPDADPAAASPADEEATLSGALLLKARSQRTYRPPGSPDPARRQAAIAAALASTERMSAELATLAPTPEHRQEAEDEGAQDVGAATLALAVGAWAQSNAYRLDAGESVAWAGEQAGYGEAAEADGQLLQWASEDDDHVCEDCLGLEGLGPLPLSEFPTTPGSGDTECSAGCRCSLEATGVPLQDELAPLSEDGEATVGKVAGQAQERLDQLAPNFAAQPA